jgi:DNA-binding MarR family transcriptional regulator
MEAPAIGERYRGPEAPSGYLLRQAWNAFSGAIDAALREHGLTGARFAVLTVLSHDPGLSGADLARACNTTPQAMNELVVTLERDGLVERRPHPTHGRILQVWLTSEGGRRLETATPTVRALEASVEAGLSRGEVSALKEWLVTAAKRLEQATTSTRP